MSKEQDRKFMISFAGVLALLIVITLGIIVLAMVMTPDQSESSAAQANKVDARTAPIGSVSTEATAAAAAPAAATEVAAVALSGEAVYGQVCGVCHDLGVQNAPKPDDNAAWVARKSAAGGVDGLVASAIKGKNAMPPRGGKADLGDDAIKAAVEWMLAKAGA